MIDVVTVVCCGVLQTTGQDIDVRSDPRGHGYCIGHWADDSSSDQTLYAF